MVHYVERACRTLLVLHEGTTRLDNSSGLTLRKLSCCNSFSNLKIAESNRHDRGYWVRYNTAMKCNPCRHSADASARVNIDSIALHITSEMESESCYIRACNHS